MLLIKILSLNRGSKQPAFYSDWEMESCVSVLCYSQRQQRLAQLQEVKWNQSWKKGKKGGKAIQSRMAKVSTSLGNPSHVFVQQCEKARKCCTQRGTHLCQPWVRRQGIQNLEGTGYWALCLASLPFCYCGGVFWLFVCGFFKAFCK